MTNEEASNQFDVLFNNITSNQAPGLNEYEKSVFMTSSQEEVLKNHYDAQSKGNTLGKGFDDSPKRQMDFSALITVNNGSFVKDSASATECVDYRGKIFSYPEDVFIPVNEYIIPDSQKTSYILQVIPVSASEYARLMSKPFKRPLKNQAWKLQTKNSQVEVVLAPGVSCTSDSKYSIRYIKRPRPIILGDLDGLSIGGKTYDGTINASDAQMSELDPIVHEEILQRAVEKAKIAWGGSQEEINNNLTSGTRSE